MTFHLHVCGRIAAVCCSSLKRGRLLLLLLLSEHGGQRLRWSSRWIVETVKPRMSVILNWPTSAALTWSNTTCEPSKERRSSNPSSAWACKHETTLVMLVQPKKDITVWLGTLSGCFCLVSISTLMSSTQSN